MTHTEAWVFVRFFDRFSLKQKTVTGQEIPFFFQICWRFVSPIIIFVMIIMTLYQMGKKSLLYTAFDPQLVSVFYVTRI